MEPASASQEYNGGSLRFASGASHVGYDTQRPALTRRPKGADARRTSDELIAAARDASPSELIQQS
jgi:hypothetical protein